MHVEAITPGHLKNGRTAALFGCALLLCMRFAHQSATPPLGELRPGER
jgi:hypothetical protein